MRPGGRLFPAWFDIFPNSERVQQVDAPVCVLHVRASLLYFLPVNPNTGQLKLNIPATSGFHLHSPYAEHFWHLLTDGRPRCGNSC